MRRTGLHIPAALAIAAALMAASDANVSRAREPQRSLNLVGEIMDSKCAIDGSHDKMMRTTGANNARECTLACAKSGASYVLYDPDAKAVYQLDDQKQPQEFAGQRVRVSGDYDDSSNQRSE